MEDSVDLCNESTLVNTKERVDLVTGSRKKATKPTTKVNFENSVQVLPVVNQTSQHNV